MSETKSISPTKRAPAIVVVNHDSVFLDLVGKLVDHAGYQVRKVLVDRRHEERAYTQVKADPPDLVVLDVIIAEMAGWTALNLIKLDPETTHIPVVVCSAPSREILEAETWLRERNCHLLLKPFDLDDLLDRISRHVEPPTPRLTRRHLEVAAGVARGLTNGEIADELQLTEGTVANHVGSIMQRLGFRSRKQIAAWMLRQARPTSGVASQAYDRTGYGGVLAAGFNTDGAAEG